MNPLSDPLPVWSSLRTATGVVIVTCCTNQHSQSATGAQWVSGKNTDNTHKKKRRRTY